MRRAWCGVMAVLVLLGCGGLATMGRASMFAKGTRALLTIPASPERDAAMEMAAEVYYRTLDEELPADDTRAFRTTLSDAMEDGVISAEEVASLRALGSFTQPPDALDADRQARKAEYIEEMESSNRRVAVQAARDAQRISKWSYPEDLEDRLAGTGHPASECSSRMSDDLLTARCRGTWDEDTYEVEVEEWRNTERARDYVSDDRSLASERDGRFGLTVQVVSRARSRELGDGLVNAGLAGMTVRKVKAVMKKQGFRHVDSCERQAEDGEVRIDCVARSNKDEADVRVDIETGLSDDVEFDAYGYERSNGEGRVVVTVNDRKQADLVLDRLFAVPAPNGTP